MESRAIDWEDSAQRRQHVGRSDSFFYLFIWLFFSSATNLARFSSRFSISFSFSKIVQKSLVFSAQGYKHTLHKTAKVDRFSEKARQKSYRNVSLIVSKFEVFLFHIFYNKENKWNIQESIQKDKIEN